MAQEPTGYVSSAERIFGETMALFAERSPDAICRRITAEDSFIPLGRAATITLPSRDSIVEAALELVRG